MKQKTSILIAIGVLIVLFFVITTFKDRKEEDQVVSQDTMVNIYNIDTIVINKCENDGSTVKDTKPKTIFLVLYLIEIAIRDVVKGIYLKLQNEASDYSADKVKILIKEKISKIKKRFKK